MTAQIYLIMIGDGRLALAIADTLKVRLSADGHDALVLVPSVRGLTPTAENDRMWQADRWPDGRRLRLVTVYEDGLLERLEALRLAAYVAVPVDQDWRVIRWGDQAGAIMLPVASARDLVDAVADHTPWWQYAAPEPVGRGSRRAGAAGPAALGRKIAAAGAAGPLLLGAHAAAAAAAVSAPTNSLLNTPLASTPTANGTPGTTVLAGFPVYIPPTEPPQETIPFDDDPSGYPPNPDYVPPVPKGPFQPDPNTVTPDGPLPSEPQPEPLPVDPIPNAAPPGSDSNKPEPIPPNAPYYNQPPGPSEMPASLTRSIGSNTSPAAGDAAQPASSPGTHTGNANSAGSTTTPSASAAGTTSAGTTSAGTTSTVGTSGGTTSTASASAGTTSTASASAGTTSAASASAGTASTGSTSPGTTSTASASAGTTSTASASASAGTTSTGSSSA